LGDLGVVGTVGDSGDSGDLDDSRAFCRATFWPSRLVRVRLGAPASGPFYPQRSCMGWPVAFAVHWVNDRSG
jgi:hypothetical protein